MNKILLLTFMSLGFASLASAQQSKSFNADEFKKNVDKTGTLCDTVYSLKVVSDTLTLLNMGGVYPHQKYTVAIKGNKVTLDLAHIKGKRVCVTGVFEIFKNQPEIVASQPEQFEVSDK